VNGLFDDPDDDRGRRLQHSKQFTARS
jgi:hypothetical protein